LEVSTKPQDSNLNATDLKIASDGSSFTASLQFPVPEKHCFRAMDMLCCPAKAQQKIE